MSRRTTSSSSCRPWADLVPEPGLLDRTEQRAEVEVPPRVRGLLALFLFSDVGENDAPTRMAIGSHLAMPSILAPAGETGMSGDESISRVRPSVMCRTVVHATGRAGDVFLCHPFMVHTATWPHRGTTPRMMAQPAIYVEDGFAIDGSDPSPVARAIVVGLGTDGT